MNGSIPPAENLHSALARAVAAHDEDATSDGAPAVREYRLREVALVLGICAALLVAFDSEGLLTWVQRMDLGPVQSAWRSVLGPINTAMDHLGLTGPRRWAVGSGAWVGRMLGASEDPLLAEGWDDPGEAAPIAAAKEASLPPPEALPEIVEGTKLPGSPSKDSAVTVLLMGDSMIGGSLGAAVSRALARDSRLRVVHAFQTATGLSRPDVYDWMKVLAPLLEREHPRLIVCSLGANDGTRIRDGDRPVDFGEAGWRTAYSARVMEMMRTLAMGGARVLWLGLPPMRAGRFSHHAQYLNAIFAQAAKKVPGVEFLELQMLVSDSAGEYATFIRGSDGRLNRFRLDDGIHYSPAGARAITRWVVDWIYERYRKLPP